MVQRLGDHGAETQAAVADLGFGLEHGRLLIKTAIGLGKTVEIIRQDVWPIEFSGAGNRGRELQELQRQFLLQGGIQPKLGLCTGAGFPKLIRCLVNEATHARVGVLEVWTGVAVKRQRLFPGEDNERLAVMAQISILDGAKADGFGEFALFCLGHGRIGLLDDLKRTADRLVEQGVKLDHIALAGREGAFWQAHQPEIDMFQVGKGGGCAGTGGGRDPDFFTNLEELFEVKLLPVIRDIDDAVWIKLRHAVADRRNVRGGVVEAAIALTYDADGHAIGFEVHDECSLAHHSQPLFLEQTDGFGQDVIIKAFATIEVKAHIETGVDAIKLL